MATTQQLIDSLKRDKQNLVSMLNSMGVEASNNETFTSLTPKVGKIVSDPILQDKTVEITENGTTTITADEGYDGLNNVSVTTNVAGSGGNEPSIGIKLENWDTEGYPTQASIEGLEVLPTYYFYNTKQSFLSKIKTINLKQVKEISDYGFGISNLEVMDLSNTTSIGKYIFTACSSLKTVTLPSNITILGEGVFNTCTSLEEITLPNLLNLIPKKAFYGCSSLKTVNISNKTTQIAESAFQNCIGLKKMALPDSIYHVGTYSFSGCKGLIQISMGGIDSIACGPSTSAFQNCTSLKAIWIGSEMTSSTFGRYAFSGCTGIKKMYINLPRATVEKFSSYSYAFSNSAVSSSVIVCNDDEGWITREEFDSIDWSTIA